MTYSRRIFRKIRVPALKAVTAVMGMILLVCMSTYDGDLRVWIPLFVVSAGWIGLIMYANGVTCGDCRYKNKCMERSRDYPCRDFKRRGDESADHYPADSSRSGNGAHVRMPGGDFKQVQ